MSPLAFGMFFLHDLAFPLLKSPAEVGQDGVGLWHEGSGMWGLHGQGCLGNPALEGPGLDSWDQGLAVG